MLESKLGSCFLTLLARPAQREQLAQRVTRVLKVQLAKQAQLERKEMSVLRVQQVTRVQLQT